MIHRVLGEVQRGAVCYLLVWQIFILITFSGQSHVGVVWMWYGPDCFVEPGINAHIWSSLVLHGKLPDLCECPRSMLPEAHTTDTRVNVGTSLVTTSLIEEQLLFILPVGAVLQGPS